MLGVDNDFFIYTKSIVSHLVKLAQPRPNICLGISILSTIKKGAQKAPPFLFKPLQRPYSLSKTYATFFVFISFSTSSIHDKAMTAPGQPRGGMASRAV